MELGMRQKSERERERSGEREREEQQVSHDETRRSTTRTKKRTRQLSPSGFFLLNSPLFSYRFSSPVVKNMAITDGRGLKWAAGIDSTATFFIDFFVDICFFKLFSQFFPPITAYITLIWGLCNNRRNFVMLFEGEKKKTNKQTNF